MYPSLYQNKRLLASTMAGSSRKPVHFSLPFVFIFFLALAVAKKKNKRPAAWIATTKAVVEIKTGL